MSLTIVEYLLEQRASFNETPLNEVDSLVFSTIAYFNFEKGALGHLVPTELILLPVAICGISHDDLFGGIWLARMGGDEFLAALLANPRFMQVKIGFYANEFSNHFEKQFSGVTFFLPDGTSYIAFRGTDNSLTGWKENFNITFMEEVPSQISARSYLEDVASAEYTANTAKASSASKPCLYVGGHSKGGNLAEYAALTCRDQTFAKIARVFSHDGPGFAFEPSERINDAAYNQKLSKTVPESSVFGMLMERRGIYRVIHATGALFAQHAATHWLVEGNKFSEAEAIHPEATVISSTLNNWAYMYEPAQRELFIDAAYDLFCAANAETWHEFASNRTENAFAVAEATAKLPPEMRARFFSMIRDIAPIMSAEAAKQARSKLPTLHNRT